MNEQSSAAQDGGLVKRVLIVDDYQEVRQLLKMMLEAEGYQVAAVADGMAAIEFLTHTQNTWIVLLDIMMPGLSGLEVCARLCAAGQTAVRHRVALMTASGLELKECPALVRTLLRKPFNVSTVREVLALLQHDQMECGVR